jgi:hypothetical protein
MLTPFRFGLIDVGSGGSVVFEGVERASHRKPDNYWGISNWMEAEAMRRMIGRWKDDQQVKTVVTNQDSKLGKVIRESRWNIEHEFDANHAKKSLDRYHARLPKR